MFRLSKKRHTKNQKAFSLIEVLTGVLVLAGLISIMVQISYGNRRRVKKASQLNKIAYFLDIKMNELKDRFKGKDAINLSPEDAGVFKQDERYSWSYSTQPIPFPSTDILLALFEIPENKINESILTVLKNLMSSTVIELKLTVSYQPEKGKAYSHSIASYFVNYEDAPNFILQQMSQISF